MRYRHLSLSGLWLNAVRLPLRSGQLLVVDRDGQDQIDWELVVASTETVRPPQATYDIEAETDEGHLLGGSAFLVRSDGSAHVLRGSGELSGFDLIGFEPGR